MIDLTNLILKYYGIATWNSGRSVILTMIAKYNEALKDNAPSNAAWCAILLCNMCRYLNYDISTANAWVDSWCNKGTEIDKGDAQMGDIVIIGDTVQRTHISTFIRYSSDTKAVYLLGGNQNNQINISPFDIHSIFKIIRLTKIKN